MSSSEYQVAGMTCGQCEASVRKEVAAVEGVQDAQVSAQTGRLVVTSVGPVDEAAVVDAVTAAGYSAVRI